MNDHQDVPPPPLPPEVPAPVDMPPPRPPFRPDDPPAIGDLKPNVVQLEARSVAAGMGSAGITIGQPEPSITNADTFAPTFPVESHSGGQFEILSAAETGGPQATTVSAGTGIAAGIGGAAGVGDATMVVTRAPFSPGGIAERIAQDPEFYQRLAGYVASELAREAAKYTGQGNTEQTIKAELIRLHDGFNNVADILKAGKSAAESAAKIIVSMRDGFADWCDAHQPLVASMLELSAICFFGYAIHHFAGATGDTAALISYAVIRKEKLSDLIHRKDGKDDKR